MPPVSEQFDDNTPEGRGRLLSDMPTQEQEDTFSKIQTRMLEAVQLRIKVGGERIADEIQTYISILRCIGASPEDIALEVLEFASMAFCEHEDIPMSSKLRLQAAKMVQTAFRHLDEQERLQKEISHASSGND